MGVPGTTHDPRVVALAKDFMVGYLRAVGAKRPADFDAEILGLVPEAAVILGPAICSAVWGASPFRVALGALVDEGKVRVWNDAAGAFWYGAGV